MFLRLRRKQGRTTVDILAPAIVNWSIIVRRQHAQQNVN